MIYIGGGAAIVGAVGSLSSAASTKAAIATEKKKDDLRRKKGVIEGQQRLASSTGRLNLAKRGFQIGEKEGTIGEADTNYAAGQAGRIASSLAGSMPLTSERQAEFSAAGSVPEGYDAMSGGNPWEMALADAQAENIDIADARAKDLGRLTAEADRSITDQDQLNAMQRTQTELQGRQEARGTDNKEIVRRLGLEGARLGFRGDVENQRLQEAYAPYLVPTYASSSPLEAIGAAGTGIAEGMRRMGVGSGSGSFGTVTGNPAFSPLRYAGTSTSYGGTPGFGGGSPFTYSGMGAGGRPIGGF
jgi:hypothetical protein